jgi:hypothetical protein
MSLLTAVSFDADAIRIIKARQSKDDLTVEQAIAFPATDLDLFLSSDRSSGYTVIINSPEAIFETIQIPPVEDKLVDSLVQTEIRRLHPELSSFSCAWRVIGDQAVDGRTVKRVACCLLEENLIEPVLEPFIRNRKQIRQIIATPYALARLITNSPLGSEKSLLCAHDCGAFKTIFLLEQGVASFSRNVPSHGIGWDDLDRQNLTMTSDYCAQALRVRPERSVSTNTFQPPVPILPVELPDTAGIATDTIYQHLPALAALLYPLSASEDLRPASYRKELFQQITLTNTFYFFALATAAALTASFFYLFSSIGNMSEINRLRQQEQTLRSVHTSYQSALQAQSTIEPLLGTIKTLQMPPFLPDLLVKMPAPPAGPLQIRHFSAKKDKEIVSLQLSGVISETSYAGAQARFESVGNNLMQVKGLTQTTRKLDPKDQTYTIEANFKP